MNRDNILQEILNLGGVNTLLELPTGIGKSRMAIEKIKHIHEVVLDNPKGSNLLVVVPRNIHKRVWEEEIKKWWPDNNLTICYTTYVSFPKYKGTWDYIIYDECHHLSERCREAICDFNVDYSVLLSATVGRNLKDSLIEVFGDIECLKIDLRTAIEDNILPDPQVFLIPLYLKNDFPTESIWKNPKAKGQLINCSWKERWQYIKQKTCPVRIYCTEQQYIEDLNGSIEWWKNRYMRTRNEGVKAKWLRLCNDRLKYLSDKKIPFVRFLLQKFHNCRTLTFCNSIEQTEALSINCINSKNKDSIDNYNKFNNGEIDHISACNMLNESMNLVDCQIGIYANLNSSETIIKQRTGRLLRHKNPLIIIPFYKGTREEDLIEKMLENYNPELITTINNINNLKI